MEPTQCSETSAFNTQTPGKYPKDNQSLQQHGESLKTGKRKLVCSVYFFSEIRKGPKIKLHIILIAEINKISSFEEESENKNFHLFISDLRCRG
jgi:hypothetical protein